MRHYLIGLRIHADGTAWFSNFLAEGLTLYKTRRIRSMVHKRVAMANNISKVAVKTRRQLGSVRSADNQLVWSLTRERNHSQLLRSTIAWQAARAPATETGK